jgi:hypothetical protein
VSETPSPETSEPQSLGSALGATETFGSAPPPVSGPPADAPAGAPADSTPPAAKSKRGGLTAIIAVAVIAVLAVAAFLFFPRNEPAKAKVGQCLAGTTVDKLDANKLKIVDCGTADAGFKVVQRVESQTYADSDKACTTAETEYVFWSGKEGKAGTVLCLVTVKK